MLPVQKPHTALIDYSQGCPHGLSSLIIPLRRGLTSFFHLRDARPAHRGPVDPLLAGVLCCVVKFNLKYLAPISLWKRKVTLGEPCLTTSGIAVGFT